MSVEVIVDHIYNVSPIYVYIIAFLIAYLENVFPPSPSDGVLVFIGYLVAVSRVHFLPVLLLSTLGGTLGYLTMYKLGQVFGNNIVKKGGSRFVSIEGIHKIERWFNKYGYWVVVGNRFLLGTRAVVSFFTGLSHLNITTTTILSAISSFVWNIILIYSGMVLGKRWRYIEHHLDEYAILITCITGIVILAFVIKKNINRKRNK